MGHQQHPAYDPARRAGFLAAQNWAAQHAQSLGTHRDAWLVQTVTEQTSDDTDKDGEHVIALADGFLAGYSAGIADLIVNGGRHG